MAQKVVKIREDASSMSDFDEMLAMTATAAAPADEEDQDTILGEFEEQFAADADQGEDDASQAQPAGANQWPVSRAEHRLIERITHRKNARPIGRNALAAKLDQQMDNRGNRLGYKPTAYNATMILQNDERTHGALELDLFTGNVRVSRTVRLRTPGISNIHVRPDGENYWDDHRVGHFDLAWCSGVRRRLGRGHRLRAYGPSGPRRGPPEREAPDLRDHHLEALGRRPSPELGVGAVFEAGPEGPRV